MLRVADCKMVGYRYPAIGEETFIHPNAKIVHSKSFRKQHEESITVSNCHAHTPDGHKARKVRSSEWRRRK